MFLRFNIRITIASRVNFNLKLISMDFEVSYLKIATSFYLKIMLQVQDASLKRMLVSRFVVRRFLLNCNSIRLTLMYCYRLKVTQVVK